LQLRISCKNVRFIMSVGERRELAGKRLSFVVSTSSCGLIRLAFRPPRDLEHESRFSVVPFIAKS
jgi:hypothetical protein